MAINFVDNAATQKTSVALSQGAQSALQEIQDYSEKHGSKKTVRSRSKEIIKSLLKGKIGKVGVEILKGLVDSSAASGINLLPKTLSDKAKSQVGDEYDLMFDSSSDNFDDQVSLSSPKKRQRQKAKKLNKFFKQDEFSSKTRQDIDRYTDLYSRFVVEGGKKLKEKIERLEKKLEKQGVSFKQLQNVQSNIKKSIRSEIMRQIKETYCKALMTLPKTMEKIVAHRGLNSLLETTAFNPRLGGEDFGGFQSGLQGTFDQAVDEVKQEMRGFVGDELDKEMLGLAIDKKQGEASESLKRLLLLAERVGFDTEKFLKDWQTRKNDMGLVPVDPEIINQNQAAAGGFNNGNSQQKDQEENQQKSLFESQLRAVYMQRAIKGNWMTKMETSFRMKKLKNGLIKLGVSINDFKKIEKEGQQVAIERFREMLKEAYTERATMYKLSGPAYNLIKTRIDHIKANLKRLGVELGEFETKNMIDEANNKIFNVSMEEFINVKTLVKAKSTPAREKKYQQLLKLLHRLAEESNIRVDLEQPNLVSEAT